LTGGQFPDDNPGNATFTIEGVEGAIPGASCPRTTGSAQSQKGTWTPFMRRRLEIEGLLFDIRRSSFHDGKGIRTTVFMKGCNMACVWCHNPESLEPSREIMFDASRCRGCRLCAEVCAEQVHVFTGERHLLRRERCSFCGKCADVCPSKAFEICGRFYTVREVLDILLRDKVFYEVSGGGVTISGGEPMVQPEFTGALAYRLHGEGIRTFLDTNGNWAWDDFQEILPYLDGIRFDLKCLDDELHTRLTGVHNDIILANLERLGEVEKEVVITMPVVAGANDAEVNFLAAIERLTRFRKRPTVQLLAYHKMHFSKLRKLGKSQSTFRTPDNLAWIRSLFEARGFDVC
jgi:glycyl-radical enzyme activating protein